MADKRKYRLDQYFQANNLELSGVSEDGKLLVKEKGTDSDPRPWNTEKFVQEALQAKPNEVDLVINTPKSALNMFPKSLKQESLVRLKTKGLGNVKGSMKFLESKVGKGNVGFSEDKGIVVKEEGIWKTLDPTSSPLDYIKDPWEFARDVQDLGGEIIIGIGEEVGGAVGRAAGAIAGAAAGASTLNPIGAAAAAAGGALSGDVAGSTVGGGVGEKVRQSLGRFVGTYEATTEEALSDVATEMIFSGGGQAVALGTIPAFGRFIKATGQLNNFIKDSVTKPAISGLIGFFNGTGTQATRQMIEEGVEVAPKMKLAAKAGEKSIKQGTENISRDVVGEAQIFAATKADEMTKQFSQGFLQKRTQDFGNGINKIAIKANKQGQFKVNFNNVIDGLEKNIQDQGIGKFTKTGKGKIKFEPYSAAETQAIVARNPQAEIPDVSPALKKRVGEFVESLQNMRIGQLKGRAAAAQVINMNKRMNAILDGIDPVKDPAAHRLLSKVRASAMNTIQSNLPEDLAKEFSQLNVKYAETSGASQVARRLLNAEQGGANKFIDNIFSESATSVQDKLALQTMLSNSNDATKKAWKEATQWKTAQRYLPKAPKTGLFQTGSLVGALGLGFLDSASGMVGTAGVLAASSPRLSGAALRSGAGVFRPTNALADTAIAVGDFIAKQRTEGMQYLLRNEAFPAAIRESLQAAAAEDQQLEMLLTEQGVLSNGQQ